MQWTLLRRHVFCCVCCNAFEQVWEWMKRYGCKTCQTSYHLTSAEKCEKIAPCHHWRVVCNGRNDNLYIMTWQLWLMATRMINGTASYKLLTDERDALQENTVEYRWLQHQTQQQLLVHGTQHMYIPIRSVQLMMHVFSTNKVLYLNQAVLSAGRRFKNVFWEKTFSIIELSNNALNWIIWMYNCLQYTEMHKLYEHITKHSNSMLSRFASVPHTVIVLAEVTYSLLLWLSKVKRVNSTWLSICMVYYLFVF